MSITTFRLTLPLNNLFFRNMNNRNIIAGRTHFYFSVFMIAIYVLIGLLLIFVLNFLQIQQINRVAAGSVLILYAMYRTIKLIRERKAFLSSTNRENESD